MSGSTRLHTDLIGNLQERRRRDGAAPLLTWYGPDDARVELSVTTVANWADKIANFLDDEGIEAPDRVVAPLLAQRPTHWVSCVWLLGCWQAGLQVDLAGSGDLGVVGPGDTADAPTVVECGLHPLGLSTGVAAGHLDFADIRQQPDVHRRAPWDPLVLGDLSVTGRDTRLVVTAGEPWPTLAQAVLAPLLGAGSTVLVDGEASPERLARIRTAERAD